MSDFTKEELKQIIKWATEDVDLNPSGLEVGLFDKIVSMIDNYCEHDNECQHDWGVGFGSIHSPVTYCKKCYCQKNALPNDIFIAVMGANK